MGMMAKIGIENHWLIGARCAHSPNQDVRPIPASEIDLLVIHSISLPPGTFGGAYIEKFFCNQLDRDAHPYFQEISNLRVSAHLLIYRSVRRCSLSRLTEEPGTPVNPNFKVEAAVTIFPSVSNLRVRIKLRTRTPNT
jgi:hypothetical protein